MVLLIGAGSSATVDKVPNTLEEFLAGSSRLREASDEFKAKAKRHIKQEEGLLYIHQHEVGSSHPGDSQVLLLGSEDATTCHVVVIRHPPSGAATMAHVDGFGEGESDLAQMTNILQNLAPRSGEDELELSLCGGFEDERGLSEELSLHLLSQAVQSKVVYRLCTIVVGSFNTCQKSFGPAPIHYGCCLDLGSGELFPATFESHGPDEVLRGVRCTFKKSDTGNKGLHSIYNNETGCIEVSPFTFNYFPGLETWLHAPPKAILEHLSTSPKVEPPDFVTKLKAAIRFVVSNPEPLKTVFPSGKKRLFRRSTETSKWTKVDS